MGIVFGITLSLIMGIIGGSAAISMIVNIGTQALTIAKNSWNVTDQSQVGLIMFALLARGVIQMGPIFLIIILVTLLVLSLCFLCRTQSLFDASVHCSCIEQRSTATFINDPVMAHATYVI